MNAAVWIVLTASERGASHVAANMPNQDSVAAGDTGTGGIIAAVADGHGHWRHLRSARGSRIATAVGCDVGSELAARVEADQTFFPQREDNAGAAIAAGRLAALVTEFVVPEVVRRWRDAVLADVAADPFSDVEQDQRPSGDDATIAYGSTLLLAVAVRCWLMLAQVGDGDAVAVRSDGSAMLPIPSDPQLDGRVTTSLCGRDAAADFRVGVVDTARTPLLAVLLATDGYGNAQVVDEWPSAFSKDLSMLLRERDEQWLAGQLPGWAARCASSDGSADDTSVALLIPPAGPGAAMPPGLQDSQLGSDDPTIPAEARQ